MNSEPPGRDENPCPAKSAVAFPSTYLHSPFVSVALGVQTSTTVPPLNQSGDSALGLETDSLFPIFRLRNCSTTKTRVWLAKAKSFGKQQFIVLSAPGGGEEAEGDDALVALRRHLAQALGKVPAPNQQRCCEQSDGCSSVIG